MIEMTTLGELIGLQRGYDLTETQRRPGTVPIVGSAGVHGYHDTAKAKGPGVTLGRSGASFGRVTFIREDFWPHNTTIFVTDFKGNEPAFIRYLLESLDFSSLNSGSAQQSLNRNFLYPVPVRKFELPEQRRIAGILSAYDELMENSQRRIRILEEMARALYREWFVHFRFPGHEEHPRVASSLGDIPKGWEATTLGEFVNRGNVTLQTGPFGTQLKAAHYSSEGTPVINVRNIGFGNLRAEKLEFLSPERVEEHRRHQLREGDIVFGRKGAVERHLLVSHSEDGWIQGSDCIRLRFESGPLKPRFLSVAFREEAHQRWMMNQCSGGATMASLNQDILCRIPIVLPPPSLIEAFESFAASTLNQGDVLNAQIQNLRRTRDLLLPRLLSGQVELKAS